MFIKDNQDGSDKTRIDYLGFIGTPVGATNMADFKRVCTTVVRRCVLNYRSLLVQCLVEIDGVLASED